MAMAKYIITYEETLAKTFIVDADNARDAEIKVYDAINNHENPIILDWEDFVGGEITRVENSCAIDELRNNVIRI